MSPQKVSSMIVKELSGHPKICIWNGEEPNPHMGHLAWADVFVITPDSVSMLKNLFMLMEQRDVHGSLKTSEGVSNNVV
ncbi:mitochondrial fission protein ELM1-like [Papaver somniferum]|uniref:mitochondrial fission protein ELM1-like n=1 Tax=Papaver somniferum TaxID=3469 RepID=UPI000E6F5F9F|nr:mitochondrial fission protein ELM1-like [Papaver somniferum]